MPRVNCLGRATTGRSFRSCELVKDTFVLLVRIDRVQTWGTCTRTKAGYARIRRKCRFSRFAPSPWSYPAPTQSTGRSVYFCSVKISHDDCETPKMNEKDSRGLGTLNRSCCGTLTLEELNCLLESEHKHRWL